MRKNKVAKNVTEFLLDLIFMTAGSVIYAVGLNGFTAPNNIAPGGVSGIAIVLNYLFGTPVGTVILLINVPIIIWAIIEIGYKLVTKTMLAVVLNAACIDIVALFMPVYHGDPLIITLIGGVCEGVGLSLVFMRGATTGGTDMIARLLNHRLRHLSMGKLMLAVDGCVVLFSAIVYKSIESAVYACIVIFVSTKIIDTILYGTDAGNGKMFFIMSRKNDVIADRIIKEMDRGLTFLKSRSGYLKQDGECSSAPCVALRCSASARSSARKTPMRSSSSAMPVKSPVRASNPCAPTTARSARLSKLFARRAISRSASRKNKSA